VIWGTNINQNDLYMRIKNFINSFIVMNENEEDFTKLPYYIEQINQLIETESSILDIDCEHIYQFDQLLYRQLENYPSDVIPNFDLVATNCYREHLQSLIGQNQQNQNMMSSLAD